MTPSCAAPPLPASSSCCGTPEQRKSTSAFRHPFKYPCYFGTDIPDQKLLVATGRTVDQINEIIGADTLGYLSTEHVVQLAQNANCGFCTACFTGKYAVKPEEVLSTDIHERHLNDRPKDEKKLGE